MFYDLYNPFLNIIKWAQHYSGRLKTALIIPDLVGKYRNDMNCGKFKSLYLDKRSNKIIKKASNSDCFILLTEQMKEIIDTKNKPVVIIDGIVNEKINLIDTELNKEKKIIMYAGSLSKQYNIDLLISTFMKSEELSNLELWFCGKGNAENQIIEASNKDKRIKYLGLLSKKELSQVEKEISFYINPRSNDAEYTKYSFPSKNLEYLLAGKPVIAFKLDGISNDYDDVFIYIKNNDEKSIRDILFEVAEMPIDKIKSLGINGYKFVIGHNCSKVQANKLCQMLKELQ